jgi:hypothetical protein
LLIQQVGLINLETSTKNIWTKRKLYSISILKDIKSPVLKNKKHGAFFM